MSTQFDLIELKFGAAEKRLFTWKFVQVRPVASGIYRRSSFVSVGRWKEKKKAAAGGDPFKFNSIKISKHSARISPVSFIRPLNGLLRF